MCICVHSYDAVSLRAIDLVINASILGTISTNRDLMERTCAECEMPLTETHGQKRC